MTTDLEPYRPGQLSTLPIEVELHHIREQRKPWTAMGLILVAAAAERMAAHLAGGEQALAAGTAAAAFVLAVVISARSRHRLMSKHLRRRFITAVWGAAGWLTYVAATGLTVGAAATLAAVGAAVSLLFWRKHRVDGRAPVMTVVADDNEFVKRWNDNIAGKGRALAGSRLTEMETITSGYRFTLELVPGQHTVSSVQAMYASLRGGLRLLPGQDLVIEAHPTEPEPAALLTIITKSTTKTTQVWPGPELSFDPERGSSLMGPYIDGEGVARWSTYRKDGMFGGFIQGGIGSGKSRLLENIATSLAGSTSHPTTIWYADGQGGPSSPFLLEHATATVADLDRVANAQKFYEMLLAAIAVGAINALENLESGATGFRPTGQRPGLWIAVDEFHNFLDVEQLGDLAVKIQAAWLTIARELRKAGVAIVGATQEAKQVAFGHPTNAENLRARMLEGNGVVMRSEADSAKNVFKVDVSPREFPDRPGYGYLARPAPGDRQAPFQGYWVNDEAIDRWAGSFPWRVLSQLQAAAVAEDAGSWYANRHKQSAARVSDNAARLARLRSGGARPREEREAEQVAAGTGVRVTPGRPFGDNMPGVDDVTRYWRTAPAPAHEPSAAERGLGESHRKVVDAIRAGSATPSQIGEAVGLGKTRVAELLKELTATGAIHQPRYGVYALKETVS